MIRHAVRTALVASLVISSACGGDSPGDRPTTSSPTSSTTPDTTHTPTSTSTAPATTVTTTTTTTNLPTTTIKNQSASNSPRTTTTTTTTVAELPGGIQVSLLPDSVMLQSDGVGPLRFRSITEITGSGITLDTSLCGSSLPSGNVCFVYLRTTGLTSGTRVNGQIRIESNAPTSPDIVNVTVIVP